MSYTHRIANGLFGITTLLLITLGSAQAMQPMEAMQARSIPILGQESSAVVYYTKVGEGLQVVVTWMGDNGHPRRYTTFMKADSNESLNLAALGVPLLLQLHTDAELSGLEIDHSVASAEVETDTTS